MGYNVENYRTVRATLEERRTSAVKEAELRKRALHAESPELFRIDAALSETGRKLFRAACMGGEGLSDRLRELRQENEALLSKRKELLRAIALPEDYTDVHYTCKDCLDTGFVGTKMCSCMRILLAEAGFRSSGLGNLIDRQSFDNFSFDYYAEDRETLSLMRYAYNECKEYAEGFTVGNGNLLLMGGTGLGKTHLSTAIARRVIERGYDVLYESAPNVFSAFEYDRFRARGDEASRSERYMNAELLIIDDLGTEMPTQFSISCLYNLINTRLNRGKSTIVSTNLSENELSRTYDARITSRLFGEYKILLFRGQDVRKQKL